YEHQLGLVHDGQTVRATVAALPGQTFPGKVEFVQPHLDPVTRTVEVRYSLDNSGQQLRPGMYAMVTLETPVAETPFFQTRRSSTPARAKSSTSRPSPASSRAGQSSWDPASATASRCSRVSTRARKSRRPARS